MDMAISPNYKVLGWFLSNLLLWNGHWKLLHKTLSWEWSNSYIKNSP